MVLRAFESRNYRLYFSGQSVSLIGTWMQRTAVYWLVYEQTQSSAMLGVAVFATQFPSFLFSIFGGVLSDRYSRYSILLTTQVASLLQALVLTWMVFAVQYSVWHILVLSVILGLINAFDVPARQALVYDMVDRKEYLPNAIALNSSSARRASCRTSHLRYHPTIPGGRNVFSGQRSQLFGRHHLAAADEIAAL